MKLMAFPAVAANSLRRNVLTIPVLLLLHLCATVLSTTTDKCYFGHKSSAEEEKQLQRISSLFGQTFKIEKQNYTYSVGICVDPTKSLGNSSVTKLRNPSSEPIILGRRNETGVMGGDTWVMLRYECVKCPKNSQSQCLGNHSSSIYIVCDPINHEKFEMELAEDDDCHSKFVLPANFICQHEEKVSVGTVFFILLCIVAFMYFLMGVIYRRLVHNAQGCQQLPHFSFWQRIGALCSDGCNYMCRCDVEPEDSWNSITNNFDSGDRDDALLKP